MLCPLRDARTQIVSTDCVENFPDAKVPTVLLYKGGTVQHSLSTHAPWGSPHPTADQVEWVLAQHEVVRTELEESPFQERMSLSRK